MGTNINMAWVPIGPGDDCVWIESQDEYEERKERELEIEEEKENETEKEDK